MQPPRALCLFDAEWHPGVVGLVASKMKERLHRPVIAFAPAEPGSEHLRGSARSIPGFHIRDALADVDSAHPGLIDTLRRPRDGGGTDRCRPSAFAAFAAAFRDSARSRAGRRSCCTPNCSAMANWRPTEFDRAPRRSPARRRTVGAGVRRTAVRRRVRRARLARGRRAPPQARARPVDGAGAAQRHPLRRLGREPPAVAHPHRLPAGARRLSRGGDAVQLVVAIASRCSRLDADSTDAPLG